MENYLHLKINIDDITVPISWEARKVYNDGTVSYYGEKREIGNEYLSEDRVYMGCTIDGQICIANKEFTKVKHLGYL